MALTVQQLIQQLETVVTKHPKRGEYILSIQGSSLVVIPPDYLHEEWDQTAVARVADNSKFWGDKK